MVDQTVDHGGCHLRIGKQAAPFGEFQVSRQDETFAFITIGDDPEKQLRTVFIDRDVAPLIKDEQVQPLKFPNQAFQSTVFSGFCQLQDQPRYGIKTCLQSHFTSLDPSRNSQMGLAYPNRSKEYKVLLFLHELAGFQGILRKRRWKGHMPVVIAGKWFVSRKSCPLDKALFAMFFPGRQFGMQQFENEIHLLGCRFAAIISPERGEEKLPGSGINFCNLLFLLCRRQHVFSPLSRRLHRTRPV